MRALYAIGNVKGNRWVAEGKTLKNAAIGCVF